MRSDISVIAGSLSTLIFAISTMPMILKAVRTRDLSSYSGGNLVLSNAGNVIYAIYIFDLPIGPVWALYGFNLSVSMVMLALWLRYRAQRRTSSPGMGSYRDDFRHGSDKSSRLEVSYAAARRTTNQR
ncbi:hypothetical protein [Streptomyces sp. NPDC006193]|uniref:hypothetical protein n=1 Tax=Streptomyces sp. NPDC006193 TaxID=3155717 RepID=UPI0033BDAA78